MSTTLFKTNIFLIKMGLLWLFDGGFAVIFHGGNAFLRLGFRFLSFSYCGFAAVSLFSFGLVQPVEGWLLLIAEFHALKNSSSLLAFIPSLAELYSFTYRTLLPSRGQRHTLRRQTGVGSDLPKSDSGIICVSQSVLKSVCGRDALTVIS